MKASIQKYLLYNSKLTLKLSRADNKYLCNSSFLSKGIVFRESFAEEPFDCSVFIIEGEDVVSSKFASNVTYSVWFYLKHFKTGKYIGLSNSAREEATDTIYDLELKDDIADRSLFRLSECYLYQSKISSYVKPGEELYLVAKLKNEKEVFMSCGPADGKAIATYNSKMAVIVDFYSMGDSQQAYNFSDHVLIIHSETQTYLCQAYEGDGLEFEELSTSKDNEMRGVWIVEAENHVQGGGVLFEQRIRLRNQYSKQYLAFSLKARVVENFKIYPVIVQRQTTDNSVFKTISIVKKDGPLKLGSYMILQNCATLGYLSNTISYTSPDDGEKKRYEPSCISQPHPRDVYRFEVVPYKKVWAINSVIAMKTQLRNVISQVSKAKKQQLFRLMPLFTELSDSFKLILKYLVSTKEESGEEFAYLQWLFRPSISLLISFLDILWMSLKSGEFNANEQSQLLKIVEVEMSILARLVQRNLQNKDVLYQFVLTILDYVCLSVGAQQLLVELFSDHLNLIVRLDRPLVKSNSQTSPPILEAYLAKLKEICLRSARNKQLFCHVIKFIKVCSTFLVCDDDAIGYNQTYITGLLFSQQNYRQFMFGCRVSNDRVRIDLFRQEKDIEDIPEAAEEFDLLIEQLNLFSILCSNRNMIAKNELSKIFSCGTLINYIQMPISNQLKQIIFKLITNIYIDSNPRTPRVLPHSVLVFSVETFEHMEPIAQEDSQMSARLNDKLIQQNGQTMRVRLHNQKLNLSNVLQDDSVDMVMEHDELQLYYMILEERIEEKLFSSEMFQSIHNLIRLECLQPKQIHKLFVLLLESLETQVEKVGNWVFELLDLVNALLDELYLSRVITIGKMIYFTGRDISSEVERLLKYILPGELSIPQIAAQLPPDKLQHVGYLTDDYNEFGLLLDLPNKFKDNIMKYFFKTSDVQRQKILFRLVDKWFLPKQHLLKLLEPCIILNQQQDVELANYLFSLFKKLYRLNESSEIWLALQTGQHKQHLKQFCFLVNDLISFLYESHHAYSSRELRSEDWQDDVKSLQYRTMKFPNVSGKRQQMIKNIGLHQIVLQFLKENFFMLQNVQETQKLICRPFFYCFDFLHGFIQKNSIENKRLLQDENALLFKYLNYVDLGQSLVISELYYNNVTLCKRMNEKLLATVIDKITLKGMPNKRISDGVFSPTLAQFLLNICIVDEKPDVENLEMVMKIISNAAVLRNLLFLDQIKKQVGTASVSQYLFNLDVKNILSGMVPYIYHSMLLKVINSIFQNIKLGVKSLQRAFLSTFDFNYLLQIMTKPDHFTCMGTEAKLTFLLKLQVCELFRNVFIHSEKDILSLKNNETATQFINELARQIDMWKQHEQLPVADRSTTSLLEIFLPYLLAFDEEFKMTFPQFLSSHYIPILKHFEGQLEKHKESQNYRLLIALENKIMSLEGLRPLLHTGSLDAKVKILEQNPNYIHNFIQFPMRSICVDDGKVHSSEDPLTTFTNSYYSQLMLNANVRKALVEEEKNFFDMSSPGKDHISLKDFQGALISFAINLSENCGEDIIGHEQHVALLSKLSQTLARLAHYNRSSRTEIIITFLKHRYFKIMMDLISQPDFNLRHLNERQLMFDVGRVINSMFGDTYNSEVIKQLAGTFANDRRSAKILTVMKDIIVASSVNKKSGLIENINDVMRTIKMSYEGEFLEQPSVFVVLGFISNLANNSDVYPFTEYFRRQRSSRSSIDFLPLLVNAAMSQILEKKGTELSLNITFAKYPLITELIKSVQTLMYGPCEENQLFLMETKFPTILLQVMKTDSHTAQQQATQKSMVRANEGIIIKSVQKVLNLASPGLAKHFQTELKKNEATHDLLVNLVKQSLLKCIEEMINGNETTLKRLTLFLPEEYLKVNLLWVYNQFREESSRGFRKNLLDEIIPDFEAMMEDKDKQKRLVLENGFIIYKLIKMYSDSKSGEDSGFNLENDQDKKSPEEKKLALIRKFFDMLRGDAGVGTETESIETQMDSAYSKEIKMYKDTYKKAVEFFDGNSVSVEVRFQEKIYLVFFPKIPMCNYFDSSYKERFKKEANRVSQISKLHSLMETAASTIDELELEENWQNRISEIHPFINHFFNFNLIMYVALLIGVFSTILFIIVMDTPVFSFPFVNSHMQQFEDVMFRVATAFCAILACLLLFMLFFKRIPVGIMEAKRKFFALPYAEQTFFKKLGLYFSSIVNGFTLYLTFIALMCSLTIANPLFSCFLLIDVFRVIDMASNILVAIGRTWRQLLAGILIFVMMNYVFAFLLYVLYSSTYAPTCENLYTCFLLLNDTYFKAGAGFFGSIYKDYSNSALGVSFLVDLAYIIFICTVIKEIFSGTIIDKFSELRQHKDAIREDEAKQCYICGLERYELDFELEGFQKHNQQTHNVFNYIFYIFYLKRKEKRAYSRLQKFVMSCVEKNDDRWFPIETSLYKINREKRLSEQREERVENAFDEQAFNQREARKKLIKEMKTLSDTLLVELKHTT